MNVFRRNRQPVAIPALPVEGCDTDGVFIAETVEAIAPEAAPVDSGWAKRFSIN